MQGFEAAQFVHDNMEAPEDSDYCTCRRRDCYDCADYSG